VRFLLLLLLAGCSHASIHAGSNLAVGASTGAKVYVESGSLAALVVAGMFMAAAAEDVREPRPYPGFASLSDWWRGPPVPELDPSRTVSEHDCSRPVPLGANLRCR
jgi:hypothetical protein